VPILRVGQRFDRFAIRNPRLDHVELDFEPLLQPLGDDAQVQLARPEITV
jgi:hypothetical protein